MKYLYYSLYQFYTKVVYIQQYYSPVINVAAVLAVLQSFLLFACVDTYIFISSGQELITYSSLIPFGVFLLLYWLNESYYRRKEEQLLKEISAKPLWLKWVIVVVSFFIIGFIIYLWMFDGLYKIVLNFA